MEKVLQRLLNFFRLGNGHVCEPFSSAVAGPRGVYSPSDGVSAHSPMFGDHGRAACLAMASLKPSKLHSILQKF